MLPTSPAAMSLKGSTLCMGLDLLLVSRVSELLLVLPLCSFLVLYMDQAAEVQEN